MQSCLGEYSMRYYDKGLSTVSVRGKKFFVCLFVLFAGISEKNPIMVLKFLYPWVIHNTMEN